jgi:calcium-dependent protein kinase
MLESYDIHGSVLGKGSFGIVVEAVKRDTQEPLAVKILERNSLDAKDLSNCKNEAEIIRKLHHPNIIRFHSYLEDPTGNYLFTEVIRGGELFDRLIERNGFAECESKTIASKILSAVAYCHSRGIVHRDIKAENVLFVSRSNHGDFDLRLIDFGFAAHAEGASLRGELGM